MRLNRYALILCLVLLTSCSCKTFLKDKGDSPGTSETQSNELTVVFELVGTGAYVGQDGDRSLIIPYLRASEGIHEHVPYVAWFPPNEDSVATTVIDKTNPITGSRYRVHVLEREEIVIKADLAATNSIAATTRPGTGCVQASATFDCIPELTPLLTGEFEYDPSYTVRVGPSLEIAGRLDLSHGTLVPVVGTPACEWEFRNAQGQPIGRSQPMAGLVRYTVTLRGQEKLTLQSRSLHQEVGTERDIITLKPLEEESRIIVRVGNSPDIFPASGSIPINPDTHFLAYYDFLRPKGSSSPLPQDVFRPVPYRTNRGADCAGSEPTLNCGGVNPCTSCLVVK